MASVLYGRDMASFVVDAHNRFYKGTQPEWAVWFDNMATDRCLELYEVTEANGALVKGDPITVAVADDNSMLQFYGPDGYDGPLWMTGPNGFPPLLIRPAYAGVSLGGGSVSAQSIADNAVVRRTIATDAVGSDEIEAGAVGSAELADGAVTEAKIATDAVTSDKIAANAVGASELADNAVDTSAIVNAAVTDAKIAAVALAKVTGAGTAAAANTGTGATNVILGNDARLTDARTPTAHKATHASGGSDALSPADIGAATSAQGAKADTAVQPSRSITAGTGLSGGGDLSANRTLGIAAGGVGTTELAAGAVTDAKVASGIALSKITPTPANFGAITTKGDLLVGTGAATVVRHAAGTDGQSSIYDSAQADGIANVSLGNLLPLNVATATDHLGTTGGFTLVRNCTIASIVSAGAVTGTKVLQQTVTGASSPRVYVGAPGQSSGTPTGGQIDVIPGSPLTVSAFCRSDASTLASSIWIWFFQADGVTPSAITPVVQSPAALLSTSMTERIIATRVPSDAPKATIALGGSFSIGTVVEWDALTLAHGYGFGWGPMMPAPNGSRVVEGADTGRAAYVWDQVNGRPQMVYYDSGWRDVSSLLSNGWTGSAYLRRADNIVMLRFESLSGTAATGDTVLTVPAGFRSESTIQQLLPANSSDATAVRARMTNTGAVTILPRATATAVSATWSLSTTNALPTTLPGTAQGIIPSS